MSKKCSSCGELKDTRHFGKHRITKDGLRSRCKDCRKTGSKVMEIKRLKERIKNLECRLKFMEDQTVEMCEKILNMGLTIKKLEAHHNKYIPT